MINRPVLGLLFRREGQLVANEIPEEFEPSVQPQPSSTLNSEIQHVRLIRRIILEEQTTKLTPEEVDYLIRSPSEDSKNLLRRALRQGLVDGSDLSSEQVGVLVACANLNSYSALYVAVSLGAPFTQDDADEILKEGRVDVVFADQVLYEAAHSGDVARPESVRPEGIAQWRRNVRALLPKSIVPAVIDR